MKYTQLYLISYSLSVQFSLVSGARKKRRSAWYTLFVHAFNLPKMWGLFSDSSGLCDVRIQT